MFTPHWAGVVGFMVFSRQGSGFQSCFSPGGQGRLHVYSPLGEWVGLLWLLPTGYVGFFFIVSS